MRLEPKFYQACERGIVSDVEKMTEEHPWLLKSRNLRANNDVCGERRKKRKKKEKKEEESYFFFTNFLFYCFKFPSNNSLF